MSSDSIFDVIEQAPELVASDFVLGGDYSQQSIGVYTIACYAAVAVHRAEIPFMNAAIDSVISQHLHMPATGVEVHAAEIWNGSTRARTSFKSLDHISKMKIFFADWCAIVGELKPFIAVAVKWVGRALSESKDIPKLKKLLVYAALGRLNTNIKITSGKHMGEPRFFHDRENEALTTSRPGDPEKRAGGMFDVNLIPGTGPNRLRLFKTFDPCYNPADSTDHRLIQIADVAAYFVGKHLRLRHQVMTPELSPGDLLNASTEDGNFCRAMWDALNLEAVLVAFSEERQNHPTSIRNVIEPYDLMFDAGADMCICSIREAMDGKGRIPGSIAIGYLS